jgi:hypothetical protein
MNEWVKALVRGARRTLGVAPVKKSAATSDKVLAIVAAASGTAPASAIDASTGNLGLIELPGHPKHHRPGCADLHALLGQELRVRAITPPVPAPFQISVE